MLSLGANIISYKTFYKKKKFLSNYLFILSDSLLFSLGLSIDKKSTHQQKQTKFL